MAAQIITTDKYEFRQLSEEELRKAERRLHWLSQAKIGTRKRMRLLYEHIDESWSRAFAEHVVCKRGCSHCCHVNVAITAVEAEHIASTHRIKSVDTRHQKRGEYTGSACPFLKDGECSVYLSRPMVCRVFGAFDSADYCADDSHPMHDVIQLAVPGCGGMDEANWAYTIILAMNEDRAIKDIREFFPGHG